MTISAPLRRIPVGATYTFRDVGDRPLADGTRIRWGRLFRSDAARFTDGADLPGLGLQPVVDLRDDTEPAVLPTGLDALVGTVLRHPLDARRCFR